MPNRSAGGEGRPWIARRSRPIALLLAAVLLVGCGSAVPAPSSPVAAGSGDPAATAAPDGASPSGEAPGTSAGTETPSPAAPATPGTLLPTASRPPVVPRAALAARLDRLRERLAVPGVSVAIRWDDGRVWLGSSGLADVEGNVPVEAGTAFSLASVSKTYTAAVALQLVEEGVIGLDDRAARWLPGLTVAPEITVRMLLGHTSGLTDYFLNPRIDRALQADPGATWTPQRTLAYIPPGSATPGTVYRYSNTNYLLLGMVIEAATGSSLGQEVRERLLAPLGLDATWTQVDEARRLPLARPYRLIRKGDTTTPKAVTAPTDVAPFRAVITAAGGAGMVAATADDAARWMAALIAGDVLRPATREAMLAPTRATDGGAVPYGLGVQITRLGGQPAYGHSGRYLGFRSVVRYVPGERLTIAVLTNQSSVDPARIAASLLQLAGTPRPECTGCPADR